MIVDYEVRISKKGYKYVVCIFRYNDFVVEKIVMLTDLEKQVLGVN